MERHEDKIKLNFAEITAKLQSVCKPNNLAYDYKEYFEACELGAFEVVESVGGEDEGIEWYRVFHFKQHNIYAKLDGWYYSYDGADFSSDWNQAFFEVTPKEVTVIQYHKV